MSNGGDQAQETKGIGEDSRCDQQGGCYQDHGALDPGVAGHASLTEFALDLANHPEALSASQSGAQSSGHDDQGQGRGGSDAFPDLDQEDQLDGRYGDEEQQKASQRL